MIIRAVTTAALLASQPRWRQGWSEAEQMNTSVVGRVFEFGDQFAELPPGLGIRPLGSDAFVAVIRRVHHLRATSRTDRGSRAGTEPHRFNHDGDL